MKKRAITAGRAVSGESFLRHLEREMVDLLYPREGAGGAPAAKGQAPANPARFVLVRTGPGVMKKNARDWPTG
jgi:hypothetical protein